METFFVNLCIKLQGGELNSSLLRKYYAQKYKVYVDKYSYGAFTPGFNFGGTSVRVGRYCSIAGDVRYFGGNHPMGEFSTSPIFYNPNLGYCTNNDIERHSLIIEDDVWIGYGVKITSGCKVIGRGAVIGAGSVVTKDVKPYTIVAGMPAKVIRNRYASEFVALFDQSNWWQLPPEALISMKNEATDIKDFCGKVINFFENGYN